MRKYIQIDFTLPSQRLYGLGERQRAFNLSAGTYNLWSKGVHTVVNDDGSSGKQTYSVHPFILVQTKNKGEYIGIYFRNSNNASPVLYFNDDGTTSLSYIALGGMVDIFFFMRGTASDMVKSYQSVVGKQQLPPFWALGWH